MTAHYSLSIITPCLNRAKYIEEAIQSVLRQSCSSLEHIIVDGGSTDGTLEILSKYAHLQVISEPDSGMYDALNKGLALSSGEIIGFLNSDDLYAPALGEALNAFADSNVMAVAGKAEVFAIRPDGATEIKGGFSPGEGSLLELSTIGSPFFNAWLFRKSVFEKLGGFNSSYRIAADRDFMLRLAISNMKYATISDLVYLYRHHEGSMTLDISIEKLEKIVREHLRMTEYYLHLAAFPVMARQLMREASTQETLYLAECILKERQYSKFFPLMLSGLRHDRLWVYKLMRHAAQNATRLRIFSARRIQ